MSSEEKRKRKSRGDKGKKRASYNSSGRKMLAEHRELRKSAQRRAKLTASRAPQNRTCPVCLERKQRIEFWTPHKKNPDVIVCSVKCSERTPVNMAVTAFVTVKNRQYYVVGSTVPTIVGKIRLHNGLLLTPTATKFDGNPDARASTKAKSPSAS